MDKDESAEAAARFSQLAEDLHREAEAEAERPPVWTGRPDLDALVASVQDTSREFSERGVEIAAAAAAAFTASIFERGTP